MRAKKLPRNLWAVSLTSFLMDISSEMVLNLVPLFLANVLGVGGTVIGAIEGVAESVASLLRVLSGYLSDRLRRRKWLAVLGYGISTLSKPFFYLAGAWWHVALARWADRVGKGIRTAPRDALVADSIDPGNRGLAFGLHRAADTAGAFLGILGALLAVNFAQGASPALQAGTFRTIVLVSLVPAVLAVLSLALLAKEPNPKGSSQAPQLRFSGLGRPFFLFLGLVGIFELGNSADAFLALRAQTLGASVLSILGMLAVFNLVYSLVSTPAGALSDRIPRKTLIVAGWLFYALVYFGIGLAGESWQMWVIYGAYGVYYGIAYGTARALIADIVPVELRGTAYGAYATVVGLMAFPASLLAGILWDTLGPSAPFFFGGTLALLASLGLAMWRTKTTFRRST
ncbi:MAG: MFS transporter [Candidatus Bipolaricaulota bacterium]|nr:MFS transporter [Candidatus Bipolaricaulota bacterium]MDW8126760.1 MFS transporter [Candidatus Bipolaricaulota bacterium]